MYTLLLVTITTVYAIGPNTNDQPTRNSLVPPSVTQSFTKAGTYPSLAACQQVADFLHDRQTAYADVHNDATCIGLGGSEGGQAAALDR